MCHCRKIEVRIENILRMLHVFFCSFSRSGTVLIFAGNTVHSPREQRPRRRFPLYQTQAMLLLVRVRLSRLKSLGLVALASGHHASS